MLTTTVTDDPKLRFTPSGKKVAELTVLVNTRRQDPATGAWTDDTPTRHRVTTWESMAEHAADSLVKGDRVLVVGRMRTETYTDKASGETRYTTRVTADTLGVSLRWATARPRKATRTVSEARAEDADWPAASAANEEVPF